MLIAVCINWGDAAGAKNGNGGCLGATNIYRFGATSLLARWVARSRNSNEKGVIACEKANEIDIIDMFVKSGETAICKPPTGASITKLEISRIFVTPASLKRAASSFAYANVS